MEFAVSTGCSFMDRLDASMIGGLLCPYLTVNEIVRKLGTLNRQLNNLMLKDPSQSEVFWKSLVNAWSIFAAERDGDDVIHY
jgi:hypothetical protein